MQELFSEILRRTRPDVDTPILTSLLNDNLFRRLIMDNYKLEHGDGMFVMYKKEGAEWVKVEGFKEKI